MNAEQKGKMEEILAELGRKMDQLLHKAQHASGDMQQEFSHRMDDLNKSKEKFEKEWHEFTQDETKWKEVQARLHNAASELRQAVEITFRKREKS